MPATTSKIELILDTELEKKISEIPLELYSVEELFNEDERFIGESAFFPENKAGQTLLEKQELNTPHSLESTIEDQVEHILQNQKENTELLQQISQEEMQEVLTKLAALVSLPPGQLDSESELYLEQQLGEVLGFQVSSSLEGQRLLYNTGKIMAMPHFKCHPTDTLKNHEYPYAGLHDRRSSYGWFMQNGTVDEISKLREKYFCALPLYYFPEWHGNHKELKKWFKYRKVICINPFNNKAVVCAVSTIAPQTQSRFQFGASPETIIEGEFWSPESAGRTLLLFVDDPQDTVTLGVKKISKNI